MYISLLLWKSNRCYILVCARVRVGACSLIYPACNAHALYPLRPLWLHHISRHYLINGTIFREKLSNIKCVF